MKRYIPIKVVHYSELKKGDLVSSNTIFEDVNWRAVFKFSHVTEYGNLEMCLEKQSDATCLNQVHIFCPKDFPQFLTVKPYDGNGTGERAEVSKDKENGINSPAETGITNPVTFAGITK